MIGEQSFTERVGRSFRANPFTNLWVEGPLFISAGIFWLLLHSGGPNWLVLGLGALTLLLGMAWVFLVCWWSRTRYLRRKGDQRRREARRASIDP